MNLSLSFNELPPFKHHHQGDIILSYFSTLIISPLNTALHQTKIKFLNTRTFKSDLSVRPS